MNFMEVFCIVLITVSVTANFVESRSKLMHKVTKKVAKRDTEIVFIEDFHDEANNVKPNAVYRKISQKKYRKSSNPLQGPLKYTKPSTATTMVPSKKYKKIKSSQQLLDKPHSQKQRFALGLVYTSPQRNKLRYTVDNQELRLSTSRPQTVKSRHIPLITSNKNEHANFGEPPARFYKKPIDSYNNLFKTHRHINMKDDDNIKVENENLQLKPITDYAESVNEPIIFDIHQDQTEYDMKQNMEDEINNLFSSNHDNEFRFNKAQQNHYRKKEKNGKIKQYLNHFRKLSNRPLLFKNRPKPTNQLLVGGQYAEPPARYVFADSSDNNEPLFDLSDQDISPTVSPYVNYKYSNIAFSPQNLNDAFSIVYK